MIGASSSFSTWSRLEDKLFERALVLIPEETPDRWAKIAGHVPGKTWAEVRQRYDDLVHDLLEIDSGRVELPSYEEELESQVWCGSKGKEKDSERRKGVPWTEEEHRLFLIGLQKYGKGDWRSISRNAVVSRTPTQVASHAQKYFLRLNSVKKEKKRSSIHDITSNMSSTPATINGSLGHGSDQDWNNGYMNQSMVEPFGPSHAFQAQVRPMPNHGFGYSF